jgi:hypothetical protein
VAPGPGTRPRPDAGQATLEHVGVVLVVALLLAGVVAAVAVNTAVVGAGASRAVCLVLTAGLGDCASGQPVTAEPAPTCRLSGARDVALGLDLTFVESGNDAASAGRNAATAPPGAADRGAHGRHGAGRGGAADGHGPRDQGRGRRVRRGRRHVPGRREWLVGSGATRTPWSRRRTGPGRPAVRHGAGRQRAAAAARRGGPGGDVPATGPGLRHPGRLRRRQRLRRCGRCLRGRRPTAAPPPSWATATPRSPRHDHVLLPDHHAGRRAGEERRPAGTEAPVDAVETVTTVTVRDGEVVRASRSGIGAGASAG